MRLYISILNGYFQGKGKDYFLFAEAFHRGRFLFLFDQFESTNEDESANRLSIREFAIICRFGSALKPDLFCRHGIIFHQAGDGLEDYFEAVIMLTVFPLHRFDLGAQFLMGENKFAQFDEGSDDLDADINSSIAI